MERGFMNYYLVDFENVRTDGIKDLKGVQEGDSIILFYSEQCKNISLDVIDAIVKLNLNYSSFKVKVGTKNALDFQLSTHLGYLIAQGNLDKDNYYIVAKDKGYDCLCEYWKEFGANVSRLSLAEELPDVPASKTKVKKTVQPKKSKVKASDMLTIEELKKVLSKEDDPNQVLEILIPR